MPVPFEALIPLGLITGFFGVSGILFQKLKTSINEGQNKNEVLPKLVRTRICSLFAICGVRSYKRPPRYGLDRWDRVMLDRDYRLTGTQRGQAHQATAPSAFSTNSAWNLEKEHL
ncbi:hypothetical protein EC957_006796 [Mortierella hygrophila]|uniref:NADH dehydrogenase [ubiquinone] 1 alpha subcomplex subunit 1 n=1 Tax=Mortierella hygrophila TaxID=979708 RepID=A0A9P6FDW8_9FUNG|nr:hypothetical protein EC957_006796 [Mortierella hygrophila]